MNWLDLIKEEKEKAVAAKKAFLPRVILHVDGEIAGMVENPQSEDPYFALNVVQITGPFSFIDKIEVVMDSYCQTKVDPFNLYDPRRVSYQKLFEQGHPNVTETLLCFEIGTADRSVKSTTLNYKTIEDKIEWDKTASGLNSGGPLAEALQQALTARESKGAMAENFAQILKILEKTDDAKERIRFHSMRALFSFLDNKGFQVQDFITATHPDWVGNLK